MKYWMLFLALVAAPPVGAGNLERALASVEGATGDGESFMSHVIWSDHPEKAYYTCSDNSATPMLELWHGPRNLVRANGIVDQPLLYGKNGPVIVMSYFTAEQKPDMATYLILPSGETHLFRVTSNQQIVKSSKRLQCDRQPWRQP